MSIVNPFADKITQLRGEKSLYLAAQEMGIDRGQLRRYEAGRIPESEAIIAKLARYYGVPLQELQNTYFETIYPVGSFFREAVFRWVKSYPGQD
jgi:transcriptional regulator with XRE-family HTH domain